MIRTNARRLTAVPTLPRPRHFIFLPYFHVQYTRTKPRALFGRRWEWQYEQRDGAISERCTRSEYVSGRGWVDVEVKVVVPNETKQEEFDIDLITMRRVRKAPAQTAAAAGDTPAADAPAAQTPKPAPKPDQSKSKSKSTPDTPRAEAPPADLRVEHGATMPGNPPANDPRVAESPPAVVADTAVPLESQPTPAESLAVKHPTEAPVESVDQVVIQALPAEPTIVLAAAEPCAPVEPLAGEHRTAVPESVDQVADTAVQGLLESQPVMARTPVEKVDTVVQDLPAEPLESQPAMIVPGPGMSVEQPAEPLAVEHQTPVEQAPAADVETKPMHPSTEQVAVPSTPAAAEQDEDLDLLRPSDVRAAAGAPGKPTRRIEGDAEKARRRAQMLAEFEAAEEEKERDSLGARTKSAAEESTGSKMPATEEVAAPIHPEPEEPHKYFVLICNPDSADMQLSALPGGVSVRETTAFDSLQTLRSPERFLPLWHVLQKGGFTVVGGEGDCLVLKVGANVAVEKRELVVREIRARILPAASAEVAVPELLQRQELVGQELVGEKQELVGEKQELVREPQQQEPVKEPQEQQKQTPKTRPFRRVFWTAVWVAACSGVVSVGLDEYL